MNGDKFACSFSLFLSHCPTIRLSVCLSLSLAVLHKVVRRVRFTCLWFNGEIAKERAQNKAVKISDCTKRNKLVLHRDAGVAVDFDVAYYAR